MKSLPIRQRLNALTCLKAGPKAVLLEVCELHENGGGKGCFITNPKLAEKLGISLATVTRTVAYLDRVGLLVAKVVKAEANRRYLVPAAAVRACYAGGSEAEQLAAVAGLTIVKSEADDEVTIVKNDVDYSQKGELTIVKSEADYSQNASRVIGDDQNTTSKSITDDQDSASLRSALAAADLLLADLKKKCEGLEAENAELRAQASASHTEGAAADVPTSIPLHVSHRGEEPGEPPPPRPPRQSRAKRTVRSPRPEVPFSESEFADYDRFAAAFEGTDYELLNLRFYYEKVRNWRQKGEEPTRKDWKATITQFFLNDRESNSLKLAPGVEFHAAGDASHFGNRAAAGTGFGPSGAAPAGQAATGYRSSRYD